MAQQAQVWALEAETAKVRKAAEGQEEAYKKQCAATWKVRAGRRKPSGPLDRLMTAKQLLNMERMRHQDTSMILQH